MPRHPGANLVPGVGPSPCRVALYGEAPGQEENARRRPFVGKAGKVLSMLLLWEGIDRDACFVSNVVKYWPGPGNPDPDPDDLKRDEPLLLAELDRVQPVLVIALGAHAARYFIGPHADLELMNGIPHESRFEGIACVPTYHPALGLHNPTQAGWTYHGIKGACAYLKGKGRVWKESAPRLKSKTLLPTSPLVIADAAIDTEGTPSKPYSVQWSVGAGEGYLVPASHAHHLRFTGRVTFHNAHYDVRMLDAMGVDYPRDPGKWEDTQVRAYVRGDQPQGLKPLAYRLLHQKRESFDDLVKPHFDRVAVDYLARIAESGDQFPRPPKILTDDPKRGKGKYVFYQPQSPRQRAASLLKTWAKDPGTDLLKGWEALPAASRATIESAYGPFPTPEADLVPQRLLERYGVMDAENTLRLGKSYRIPPSLGNIYRLGVSIIPSLIEMEAHGLPFSKAKAAELCEDLEGEAKSLRRRLRKLSGRPWLNPASPQQVQAILFEHWGVQPTRTTKLSGNPSTDDRTLSTLKLQYADRPESDIYRFVTGLQDYRERRKLIGTYVGPDALPSQVVDGYVHSTLKATFVASGRLSSESPDLQNIPVRTEMGRRMRSCFEAPEGYCLLSVDYSQIELRIAAHESRDEGLIRVYREGLDLHRITERDVFGIPDAHAGSKRIAAKTFNFRVLYAGRKGSPRGLREQLFLDGITLSEPECADYRDRWFALYPGVGNYMEKQAADARNLGYATTSGGRRRWLPFCRLDEVGGAKAEADRQAGNLGVQGGAQEVIQRAMVRWDREYRAKAQEITECRLVLQIHDELMFMVRGVPKGRRVKRLAALLIEMLTVDSDQYRVPILAEAKVGRNWGEQVKLAH